MSVSIEVFTELNRRAADRTATEIEKKFHDVGFQVTPEMDKKEVEAVHAYLEKRFDNIKADVKVDIDRSAVSRATEGFRDLDRAVNNASTSVRGFDSSLAGMGKTVFQSGRGMLTLLAPIAGIVAIDFAQWAVQATGALGLIPAMATTAAAGIGTLALATQGFGQAIKDIRDPEKFATDLASLAPAAQQAALEIRNLLPVFDELKNATQESLFSGVAEQLHNLTDTFLPSFQGMTTSIATSFNQMFTGITNQMMTIAGQSQVQDIFDNISATFRNLVPGAQSFSQALLDITQVGSGFLPGLAQDLSDIAGQFAEFIRNARDSGKLQEWIQTGIDAIKMLGHELWEISGTLLKIFGNGGDGQGAIENFKDDLESINDVLKLLNGDFSSFGNELIMMFNRWGEALQHYLIDKINGLIDRINTIPGIGRLFPDIPHIDSGPGPAMGGGGSFGPAPNTHWFGRTPLPWQPITGPPPLPPLTDRPIPGGGLGYNPNGGAGAGLPGYSPSAVPAPPPTDASGKPLSHKELIDAARAKLNPADFAVPGIPTMPGGPTGPSAYSSDSALLSQVPAGVYDASGDLSQGLGDCSSAVEDLVNILQGAPTAGRNMATGNAAEWLTAHGFLPGSMPGALNVGFNSSHMQATLPGGTPFNWGSNEAAARGGVGGTGAFDPAFTSHFYLPTDGGTAYSPLTMSNQGNPYQSPQLGYSSIDQQAVLEAQNKVISQGHDVQEAKMDLAALEQSGVATEKEITDAQWKVWEQNNELQSAQADLADKQQGTFKKLKEGNNNLSSAFGELGANLDADLGISKGLPGIADNLVKFVASLAAAPLMGQLAAISGASPSQGGYGAIGIAGAQGAFGPQFTGIDQGQGTGGQNPYTGGFAAGAANTAVQHRLNWDAVAQGESSGNWQINTGNGYFGGLQFTQSSWEAAGGTQYAPQANLATPDQQKMVADRLYDMQGPGAWPNTAHLGMQRGGIVPGFGNGDKVPVLLEPGEIVIPRMQGGGYIDENGNPRTPGPAPGPSRIGGLAPSAPNPGGGGVGMTSGGTIDSALSIAASGLDVLAPGAGQAAQTGIKLANRAIQYAGQVAGIGVSGLMETFLPTGGSELANNSWLTRIAGGIAGAAPALPNMAGGSGQGQGAPGPLLPEQITQHGTNPSGSPGPGNQINVTYNNIGATEDRAAADLSHQLRNINASGFAVGQR